VSAAHPSGMDGLNCRLQLKSADPAVFECLGEVVFRLFY
jgi:hypothetical protein